MTGGGCPGIRRERCRVVVEPAAKVDHLNRNPKVDRQVGKVQRAVEAHVLDEVREPTLIVILEHGARVDDESKLSTGLWLSVDADVVAQAIRERADGDER